MDDNDFKEKIDFTELEKELHAAIEAEEKYVRENDAKLRAVHTASSYDEFREIVKASHLKPLDKGEKANLTRKNCIWNTLATKKKPPELESMQTSQQIKLEEDRLPETAVEFQKRWRTLNVADRLSLLKQMGTEQVGQLVQAEIPVGLLGELVQAVLPFQSNTADVVFVVRLLQEVSKAKRFNLNLQFLSSVEKSACKDLVEKLNNSFKDRQQDLAEEGITEWTVHELKNKYKV
ncbi:coiled-coil domain-containing protein 103 isoform X2 [Anabrus simplex]